MAKRTKKAPAPKKPRRTRDEIFAKTHQAILDAVIDVIARLGLSATTLQQVANVAGVSSAAVVLHFRTKEGMLEAVLDLLASEFETYRAAAMAEADGNPVQYLKRLVESMFDPKINSPKKIAVWNAFWGEAESRKIYLRRISHIESDYERQVVGCCREIMKDGRYSGIDPEAVGIALIGLLEWLWQEHMVAKDKFDVKRAKRLAHAHLAGAFPKHF